MPHFRKIMAPEETSAYILEYCKLLNLDSVMCCKLRLHKYYQQGSLCNVIK